MTRGRKSTKNTSQTNKRSKGSADAEGRSKSCQDCPEWQAIRQKVRVSELLAKAIEAFEKKINAQDFKPTVTEYLKLLQVQQELEATDGSPKEIKVTWVDPASTSEPEQ